MAIKYEAYNWLGEKVEGVLDTDSEEIAYERLQQDELIPYRLWRQRRLPRLVRLMPGLFKPAPQELIDFSRQLASLLRAGVPLRQGLVVLQDSARSLGMKEALRQVVEDIEAGDRFSDACSRHPTVFPRFYVRLVRVGEATGNIASTLQQLFQTLADRKHVRDRVKSALTYPAISIVIAAIAGFILVTYSLPGLTGLLEEFGGKLPAATRLLLSISQFLEAYGTRIIIYVFASGFAGLLFFRTRYGARLRAQLLLKLPVVGRVMIHANMFFLTNNLTNLLDAGLSPIEALQMAEDGMDNILLREKLARVTKDATEGTRLGQAFTRQTIFPTILSQALVSGESRGGLSDTLRGLADYYQLETDRVVGGAVELIQPAIILILAGIVGFVAVAIISGIYSTLGSIQ